MPESSAPRRLLIIANPAAGGSDRAVVSAVADALAGAGDVAVAAPSDPGELAAALDSRSDRRLVVAGGDGSLHTVVAALHHRGELSPSEPLGLVPLGTGNDLARAIGVPLEPEEAARVLLTGRPRRLDLLVDDAGGIVLNAVHVGVGAEAAAAAADLKPRLGSVAYPLGSVLAGARSPGWRLRVTVDGGQVWDGREPLLMVALGNGTTIGGGTPLTPEALPDDGLVDVMVSAATGPLERLGYAVDLRSGSHPGRDDVVTARGRIVTVEGEPFPVNTDGELSEPVGSRTWTVHAGAWAVIVPG